MPQRKKKNQKRKSNNRKKHQNKKKGHKPPKKANPNANKPKNQATVDLNVEFRKKLEVGSQCRVYSDTLKKWFIGKVTQITTDDEGEWLHIEYKPDDNNDNDKKIKQIQRLSQYIKPLTPITPATAPAITTTTTTTANGSNKKSKKKNSTSTSTSAPAEEKKMDIASIMFDRPNKKKENKKHEFWNNQPVPQMGDKVDPASNGPIQVKTLDDVRKIPLLLPAGFKWIELDLNDDDQVDELYHLLAKHYVEDDDNRFRFNYSKEFLRWALMVPGYKKEWHLSVRKMSTGKLVGCITAIPANVEIYSKKVNMVEINFLCVHKDLRSKKLAPVLIQEVTRRVNVTGRWQAVYTAGVVIPKPIASNRYWHRSLKPDKLVDVGFSAIGRRMTKLRLRKLFKLPNNTSTSGLRPMVEKDCISAHKLLTNYLNKFSLHVHFTIDEFKHCFLTKNCVVYSYVIEDQTKDEITDFISFYELPSTIMNHAKYKGMRAAYSYYNVVTSVAWEVIMKDALILAKKLDFDVFNALDVMENSKFLKELKFKIGDGHLQYYLFNWKCPPMDPEQVALVLL